MAEAVQMMVVFAACFAGGSLAADDEQVEEVRNFCFNKEQCAFEAKALLVERGAA